MNRFSRHCGKNIAAFTLIEILTALAILSILSLISLPFISESMGRAERDQTTAMTRRMLSLAREWAISLERDVKICGLDENLNCNKVGFHQLAVFVDLNNDGALDDDDTLIAVKQIRFDGQRNLWSSNKHYMQFKHGGNVSHAGSFIYCHPIKPELSSRVTVNTAGRTYIARDLNDDGVVETASGEAIDCS